MGYRPSKYILETDENIELLKKAYFNFNYFVHEENAPINIIENNFGIAMSIIETITGYMQALKTDMYQKIEAHREGKSIPDDLISSKKDVMGMP